MPLLLTQAIKEIDCRFVHETRSAPGFCVHAAQAAIYSPPVVSATPLLSLTGTTDTSWSSAFIGTLLMIICSELGDKTFLITAILSMRCTKSESSDKTGPHVGTRWHVFAGGFLALAVMTLLAAAGGRVIPLFLKQELRTVFMAALLVLFGLKMLYDAMIYEENNEEPEELKEVSRPEHGAALVGPSRLLRAARYFFSPIFIQAASLTLMAEWGDRSQLATFALAADRSASAVCLGAILGHGLCTGLAVLGGNVLAKRISERLVLLIGGICFLSFALFTVVDELFSSGGIMK
ncbi:GDT1-like protein 3 [Cyclospora cayetanensis]|uniref:GDT1 family protein n=1 Tax=Cyclospora cayetanensis TaxID=88456 RepID=A0A6P6RS73_9EIME|nr:GDT1-like protein 3 [Cyclospora cayetanensis]